jgi:hypothetical protein
MASTKVFDTITALLAFFDAALTVPVRDGPYVVRGSDPLFVVVGHNGDPESNNAAGGGQAWSALGTRARDETASVDCVVDGWSGGSDLAALRQTVEDALDAISTALRTDPTLGGAVQSAGMGGTFNLSQEANEAGLFVRYPFTVDYMARI